MKTIKWGIIGAGRISSTFAKALNSMNDTKLIAVASRDLCRAQSFAQKFHAEKAYGSYEEIVRDPEVDVIYIGTPHSEHMANTALCITNGKAVLCEKPFTVNQKEAEYLISLAGEHKTFLMEAMWTKFLPVTQAVRQWIKDKKIGEVRTVHCSMGFRARFDLSDRLFNPDTAGGALLDIGVYPITYVTYLLDRLPDRVASCAVLGSSHIDEQNAMIFTFRDGAIADISTSIISNSGQDTMIIGEKGKIRIPDFWMAEHAYLYDESGTLTDTADFLHKTNGYEYEAEEVNTCICEGRLESRINPLKDTLEIIKIMDSVRKEWGLVYPQEQ